MASNPIFEFLGWAYAFVYISKLGAASRHSYSGTNAEIIFGFLIFIPVYIRGPLTILRYWRKFFKDFWKAYNTNDYGIDIGVARVSDHSRMMHTPISSEPLDREKR